MPFRRHSGHHDEVRLNSIPGIIQVSRASSRNQLQHSCSAEKRLAKIPAKSPNVSGINPHGSPETPGINPRESPAASGIGRGSRPLSPLDPGITQKMENSDEREAGGVARAPVLPASIAARVEGLRRKGRLRASPSPIACWPDWSAAQDRRGREVAAQP